MRVTCFWVEKLPVCDWDYLYTAPGPCPVHGSEHRHVIYFKDVPDDDRSVLDQRPISGTVKCDCGFEGLTFDHGSGHPRWKRLDTGEVIHGKLPVGALYVTDTFDNITSGWSWKGADGKCVVCVTPEGHWYIDSRCSNCTRQDDITHRCWVRHGTVGDVIHVDKNGNTCSAGAGSIMMGKFHGFLHAGELYDC